MGDIKTKRLFVAINLPIEIKREIFEIQKEINNQLGDEYREAKVFKFVAMENLHITLKFIGTAQLPFGEEEAESIAKNLKSFEIKTERICYDNEKVPRLIWLTTNKGHITLARIKQWVFKKIEPEERPSINQDFARNFSVNSIELMESVLHKTGPEYKIIKSFSLNI